MLIQATGRVGIDTTSNATYSDMLVKNGAYYKLSEFASWRFYFNAIVSFSSFATNLFISHQYPLTGQYEISITFTSSMAVFRHMVQITQSKFKIQIILIILNYYFLKLKILT